MTFVFKHPKFYRIPRDKSDQVISNDTGTPTVKPRAPGPGLKHQATSYKLPGPKPISNANKGLIHKRQATSVKHQALKLSNQPVPAPSSKHQALPSKHQASSHKRQAASSESLHKVLLD